MRHPLEKSAWLAMTLGVVCAGCADEGAPTWVEGELRIEGEPRSLRLVWSSADDDTGVVAYLVNVDGEPAARLGADNHHYSLDELDRSEEHRIEVVAVDAAGNESVALQTFLRDETPPRFLEGRLIALATEGPRVVEMAFPDAEDDIGVTAYVLRVDGEERRRVDAAEITVMGEHRVVAVLEGVDLSEPRTFSVVAVDAQGNESEPLTATDGQAPEFPGGAELVRHTDTETEPATWRLAWPAASDDVGVTGYVVVADDEEVARVGPEITEYVLGPVDREGHRYRVAPLDAAGHTGRRLSRSEAGEAERAAASARHAEVERAMAQLRSMLIGSLGSDSGLSDVLRGGDVWAGSSDALAQAGGVGVATADSGRIGRGGGGRVSGLGSLGPSSGPPPEEIEPIVRGRVVVGQRTEALGPGTFDPAVVRRSLRMRARAIQACYERQLRRDPSLDGLLDVELTITPAGSVSSARAVEDTVGSPAVGTCAVSVVRRLRFNPGPEGGSVTYRFPLTFARAN